MPFWAHATLGTAVANASVGDAKFARDADRGDGVLEVVTARDRQEKIMQRDARAFAFAAGETLAAATGEVRSWSSNSIAASVRRMCQIRW